jgi:hypothetical protein
MKNQLMEVDMLQVESLVKLLSDQLYNQGTTFTYMWVSLRKRQWTSGTWYWSRGDLYYQTHKQHHFQSGNRLVRSEHQRLCGLLTEPLSGTETEKILHLQMNLLLNMINLLNAETPSELYSVQHWFFVIEQYQWNKILPVLFLTFIPLNICSFVAMEIMRYKNLHVERTD